jgi:hypothetical protein
MNKQLLRAVAVMDLLNMVLAGDKAATTQKLGKTAQPWQVQEGRGRLTFLQWTFYVNIPLLKLGAI